VRRMSNGLLDDFCVCVPSPFFRAFGGPSEARLVYTSPDQSFYSTTYGHFRILHTWLLAGIFGFEFKRIRPNVRSVEAKSTEFSRVDHSPAELNSVDLAFTKHHRSGCPKIVPNKFRIRRFRAQSPDDQYKKP
jgi:hypothetical protein